MMAEKGTITFGNRNIEFLVKRSRIRRTISIFVDPHDGVFLRAPISPTFEALSKLIRSKADWILKKQKETEEVRAFLPKREFVSGETFLYLGRQLRLRVLSQKGIHAPKLKYIDGRFVITMNGKYTELGKKRIARRLLTHWLRRHARSILANRMKIYAKKLNLSIPMHDVANQTKRWGSCSHKGKIRFNWHIIMAPLSLVDYVVAHELCHLKHQNHSQEFWKLLGTIMPDYEAKRERLRKDGQRFYF